MDCAGAGIAVTLFLKSGANDTAVLGSSGDGARTLLDAAVARYRALGISTE
jgi:fructose-1-phosphate kinase PfkB-like protein